MLNYVLSDQEKKRLHDLENAIGPLADLLSILRGQSIPIGHLGCLTLILVGETIYVVAGEETYD